MTVTRWRAPVEQGASLIVPSWEQLPEQVEANQSLLKNQSLTLAGYSLEQARQLADTSLQQALQQWAAWAGASSQPLKRPYILTGHQPELYHPGVWAKNLGIHELAKKLAGSSLNLNVDADLCKTTSLKIPVDQGEKPDRLIPWNPPSAPAPFEEWQCQDENAFTEAGQQLVQQSHTWPWQPIFPEFWNEVQKHTHRTPNIPLRWLLARQTLERQIHLANQEFLMSHWCTTPFFRWLLGVFHADADRFASIYNEELHRYRRDHRIRSSHHPVADLLQTEEFVELPFWCWPAGTSQRGRLCLERKSSRFLCLLPREQILPVGWEPTWPLGKQEASGQWKIRPKALITSMMFRLFVADLFVHGIGGAIYDELTDRIFARFWNITLPRFAIITATLRLPWNRDAIAPEQPRALRQTLRRMHWNPDRFLSGGESAAVAFLQEEKNRWITQPLEPFQRRERHEQLEVIRQQLQPFIEPARQQKLDELQRVQHQQKWDEHHFSREYAWILYPRHQLLSLLAHFPT
ncbi:MAG TPA: hypothetical protein PKD72_03975 [Gemmatales bacterium]|nr:hypothetical protein [Gemmatales bacterium]